MRAQTAKPWRECETHQGPSSPAPAPLHLTGLRHTHSDALTVRRRVRHSRVVASLLVLFPYTRVVNSCNSSHCENPPTPKLAED